MTLLVLLFPKFLPGIPALPPLCSSASREQYLPISDLIICPSFLPRTDRDKRPAREREKFGHSEKLSPRLYADGRSVVGDKSKLRQTIGSAGELSPLQERPSFSQNNKRSDSHEPQRQQSPHSRLDHAYARRKNHSQTSGYQMLPILSL